MILIRNRDIGMLWRLLIAGAVGVAIFMSGQTSCCAQSKPIERLRPTKGIIDQLTNSESQEHTNRPLVSGIGQPRQAAFEVQDQEGKQVQHAYFNDGFRNDLREIASEEHARESEGQSFIERERAASTPVSVSKSEDPKQLAIRLAINLMLVLGIAVTVILGVKHWHKTKNARQAGSTDGSALRIETTLPLSNGASLHLIEASQSKFLVAVDSTGIKSIEALANGFQETMNRMESQMPVTAESDASATSQILSHRISTRREANASMNDQRVRVSNNQSTKQVGASERVEDFDPEEDTKDIDAKLIKLLLRRSNQTA